MDVSDEVAIVQCSACAGPIELSQMAFINYGYDTMWSDGQRDDYYSDTPFEVCPHCGVGIWTRKLRSLGSAEGSKLFPGALPVKSAAYDDFVKELKSFQNRISGNPMFAEGMKRLEAQKRSICGWHFEWFPNYPTFGPRDPDELFIRLNVLWLGNNPRRRHMPVVHITYDGVPLPDADVPSTEADGPLTDVESGNIAALCEILSESIADELLLKAELLREVGQFGAAGRMLAKFDALHKRGDKLSSVACTIESLVSRGDKRILVVAHK